MMHKLPTRADTHSHSSGFTLIELMITVAIIAILASVALPSYTDYVTRGKMPEAFDALSTGALKLEQYYQNNSKYNTTGTTCGVAPGSTKYFTLSCTADASTFTITATGKDSMAGYDYTINQAGTKGTSKFKNASQSGKSCWLTKAGDC